MTSNQKLRLFLVGLIILSLMIFIGVTSEPIPDPIRKREQDAAFERKLYDSMKYQRDAQQRSTAERNE